MTQHDDKTQAETAAEPSEPTPAERIARRRLLKMVYVAPVIVGTLLISEDAAGQQQSCQPYLNPCHPPPPCKPRPPTKSTRRR